MEPATIEEGLAPVEGAAAPAADGAVPETPVAEEPEFVEEPDNTLTLEQYNAQLFAKRQVCELPGVTRARQAVPFILVHAYVENTYVVVVCVRVCVLMPVCV